MDDISSVLDQGLWFSTLPLALKEELMNRGRLVELDPGECLFARGDETCGLYAVLQGAVRATGVASNGKEAILSLIEAPQWFGELALFDGKERTHDAMSEGKTTLWKVPQKQLVDLLEAHPDYWQHFGKLLTEKLRLAFQALEDITLLPAPLRLAKRLILMTEGISPTLTGSKTTLDVPQEVLGSMLGISRQTTNQILKDLQAKGIIELSRGHIHIVSISDLREYAAKVEN